MKLDTLTLEFTYAELQSMVHEYLVRHGYQDFADLSGNMYLKDFFTEAPTGLTYFLWEQPDGD